MMTYRFKQSFRWFGPKDQVSLADIAQAGCTHVVTALHHIENGSIWPIDEIRARKQIIEKANLKWEVVESLPVHEDIKRRSGNFELYIANYKQSIKNLAAEGIHVITYNFMPVLDWTRTNLAYSTVSGGFALRFDFMDYVAFDLFVLKRKNARYEAHVANLAEQRYKLMAPEKILALERSILSGLPGSELQFDIANFQTMLDAYEGIDRETLQKNLIAFLAEVTAVAKAYGATLALHPDDPPFSLFGLPRIASTAADFDLIFSAVPELENGFCFCSGSLGVLAENNLEAILDSTSQRIHFVHLRNVQREETGSFHEAEHLEGSVNMERIVAKLVSIMDARRVHLSMRPDHGHAILDDIKKKTNPGYTAIGRLKGLAELRGLERGIGHMIARHRGKG